MMSSRTAVESESRPVPVPVPVPDPDPDPTLAQQGAGSGGWRGGGAAGFRGVRAADGLRVLGRACVSDIAAAVTRGGPSFIFVRVFFLQACFGGGARGPARFGALRALRAGRV